MSGRQQHYIPQLLQRNFAFKQSGDEFHVYFTAKDRRRRSQRIRVASDNNAISTVPQKVLKQMMQSHAPKAAWLKSFAR